MKLFSSKKNIALFIAALFHSCGVIGILCTPYKNWFIQHTPLNLLLMALLVVFTQKQKNIAFFSFLFIAFMVGMGTEIIGVNTGKLFGDYSYGNLMGRKWNNVPLLIGLNWFVLVYCSGVIMLQLHEWMEEKYALAGTQLSPLVQNISLVVDGALLATFFDWVMEPVAVKLGFWKWLGDGDIPDFNFLCWFMISTVLMLVFKWLPFNKHNQFAVHLYIIQLLFFLILRTFL